MTRIDISRRDAIGCVLAVTLFVFVSCETRTAKNREPEKGSDAITRLPQTAEHKASAGSKRTTLSKGNNALFGKDQLRPSAESDLNPVATRDGHSTAGKRDDFTVVAVVFDESTENLITDELEQHHIVCFSDASLGLAGVYVRKCDTIRAREIVQRSVRINHKQVRLADEWSREMEERGVRHDQLNQSPSPANGGPRN
jgi:hypothetical protein